MITRMMSHTKIVHTHEYTNTWPSCA